MVVDNLKILGRDWVVDWADDLGNNYGECDHEEGKLNILDTMDSFMTRSTLLHEVLHAILRQQGRYYCKAEEEYVTSLANGIINVMDDNPHFMEYLCAK